jgi:hypothetical protein
MQLQITNIWVNMDRIPYKDGMVMTCDIEIWWGQWQKKARDDDNYREQWGDD